MIIGTAGHVDHGKTSLVRALTGTDTDRLVEEKKRGISIELGFAYLPAAEGPPIGFVDAPGHRRFVQTMIAGAAGIDLGLLVVAADDGPMPQTREHLDILRWLGVPSLVVALNKVDRVDDTRRGESLDALAALLETSPYRGAPIVPVSAVSGSGLDELTATLMRQTPRAMDHQAGRRFRLAIDRAFVLQGIGLVVTGTCFAGRVAVDDRLVLLPGGLEARVRTIHAQNRAVGEAHAGQRVALNLVGRGVEKSTVQRGGWIVDPSLALESDRIDVGLTMTGDRADEPLGRGDWRSVRFHAGAASLNARVTRLDGDGLAQLVFERPAHVLAGDRFVLRDASTHEGTGSIAGGVVLDVDVPARGRRTVPRFAALRTAWAADPRATLLHAVDASDRGVALERWNRTHNTAFDGDALGAHVVGPADEALLFSPAHWDALKARVVAVLDAEHARAPDSVGPGRDRLRRMATPSLSASAFTSIVTALKAEGRVAQTGAWLHRADHRVELSIEDRARFDAARALLAQAPEPGNPPRVRDLAKALGEDEAALRGLFVRLASRGDVYRVAHDHYFLPDVVRELAQVARDIAAEDGVVRAAPFRDRIGIGRKVAIQILEFFDRVGYTRRLGDDHRVIQPTLFDP